MKRFLRAFNDIFVAVFTLTFLILIAYYCKYCNTYYVICLFLVSIFIPIYIYFNSFRQLKAPVIKWLYFAGILCDSIYLILNGIKYLAFHLVNQRFYSLLCMLFLASSIALFLLMLYSSIKICFSKEQKFQLSDIVHFKKLFNFLIIIITCCILTYPTNFQVLMELKEPIIRAIRIEFHSYALALAITLGCYIIGSILFEIIFYKYLKTDKINN